jgi:hypothetical protein
MLPAAAPLKKADLLYVVQPGTNPGEKARSLSIEALAGSDVLRFGSAVRGIMSNIITYTGALPWSGTGTRICRVRTDPRNQVIFFVEGTSGSAGEAGEFGQQTYTGYQYGLKAMVRSYFYYNDQDYDRNDQYITAGNKQYLYDSDSDSFRFLFDQDRPTYKGSFFESHLPWVETINWDRYPEGHDVRTKEVDLYLAGGVTGNPYRLSPPSSYTIKVQALITPAQCKADVLQSLATP